jgi:hypothetical protein
MTSIKDEFVIGTWAAAAVTYFVAAQVLLYVSGKRGSDNYRSAITAMFFFWMGHTILGSITGTDMCSLFGIGATLLVAGSMAILVFAYEFVEPLPRVVAQRTLGTFACIYDVRVLIGVIGVCGFVGSAISCHAAFHEGIALLAMGTLLYRACQVRSASSTRVHRLRGSMFALAAAMGVASAALRLIFQSDAIGNIVGCGCGSAFILAAVLYYRDPAHYHRVPPDDGAMSASVSI